MTTITATQAATQTAPRTRDNYGRLWLRVPQELGFLLLNLPVAIISLVVLSTLFFTGSASSPSSSACSSSSRRCTRRAPSACWNCCACSGPAGRDRPPAVGEAGGDPGLLARHARPVRRRPLLALPAARHGRRTDRRNRQLDDLLRLARDRPRRYDELAVATLDSAGDSDEFWLHEVILDWAFPDNDWASSPTSAKRCSSSQSA